MRERTNFITTAAVSAISGHKRKKQVSKIAKLNEANRRIADIGKVSVADILPESGDLGNVCISGGTNEVRNRLLLQNCRQSMVQQIPTIIIHEGNYRLEYEVKSEFSGKCFCRIVNAAEPFYEPVFRLDDDAVMALIREASREWEPIGAEGGLYIKSVARLSRAKSIIPYIRMLGCFPYNSAQPIISRLENSGKISGSEAAQIRNDISAGAIERARIEQYFAKLNNEADIISWKGDLGRSTSIAECIKNKGILVIDIGSNAKKTLIGMIRAEMEKCIQEGAFFRAVFDVATLAQNPLLIDLLGKSLASFFWTLSSADINLMVNACGNLAPWTALTHKTFVFANSLKAAEALSEEFGEYDFIHVTNVQGGSTDFGKFGLHFGANDNIQTSNRREKVVKPEEIMQLEENEFFALNNNNLEITKGVIS